MPATKTYIVTSTTGQVLAKGLDKKAAAEMVRSLGGPTFAEFFEACPGWRAAEMVRSLGGPTAATFKAEAAPMEFEPAQQFTVGEWAEALRDAGYMRRR